MSFLIKNKKRILKMRILLRLIFIIIFIVGIIDFLYYGLHETHFIIGLISLVLSYTLIEYIPLLRLKILTAKSSIYSEKEKYQQAIDYLDFWSKIYPKKYSYFIDNLKAMVLIKKGDYSTTSEKLDNTLNKHPDYVYALYSKACLESLLGDKTKALQIIKKILLITEKRLEGFNKNRLVNKIAINNPYKQLRNLLYFFENDDDLTNVRKTKEYKKMIERYKKIIESEKEHI